MTYRSEYIRSFIKVDHCKEETVRILLTVSVGVCHNLVLVIGLPARKRTKFYDLQQNVHMCNQYLLE